MTESSAVARPGGIGGRPLVLLVIAGVLVALAVAAAVFFGIRLANASGSDAAEYSAARDDVQRVGNGAALNFTNIDYTKPDDYLRKIAGATTGALHSELASPQRNKSYRDQIANSRATVTSRVLDSAVTSLDLRPQTPTATMIVALKTTATRAGGKPSDETSWVQLELQKTGDGWKVSKPPSGPGSSIGVGP